MTDQVSVRLAVVGGTQFRNEMNAAGQSGTQAMNRMQVAASRVPPAFNGVAIQAGAMAARMAGASPVASSLAGALGMAVAGASAFGIAGGLAAVALGTMVPLLIKGRQSAAEMAVEMVRLEGSVGGVTGATSALEQVQKTYADAVRAQGGASSAAATAVVAASKREFAARKEVLAVELELLRVRGSTQKAEITKLQGAFAEETEVALQTGQGLRYQGLPDPTGFAARRRPGRNFQFEKSLQENSATILSLRKLRAEAQLTQLALEKGETALDSTFKDVGGLTLGGKEQPGKGGGGGAGQAAQNKLLAEGQRLFDQTRTAAEKYAMEMAKLNDLLKAGAIDQDTYNRRAAELRDQLDANQAAMRSLDYVSKEAGNALIDALMGGKDAGQQLIKTLQRAVLEAAILGSGPLAGLFGGAKGGGLFGGKGGGLLGFLGGIFGGARANGGPVDAGMAYLVGERGPEMFMPSRSGTIVPNAALRAGSGAAGGGPVRVVVSLGDGLMAQVLDAAANQSVEIVQTSIAGYDRHMLPQRISQISADPRRKN